MDNDNANTEGNTKITLVVKEKVKDPRRVAQGKKVAGISGEAKERKAREREAAIRKEEAIRCEEQQETNASYGLCAIIPIIGIAFGGYYFLYLRPTKMKTVRTTTKKKNLRNKNRI